MFSNKRHLENGGALKFKPRKVSVVRDFPPHCGPIVVPVDSKPEETGLAGVGIFEVIGAENSRLSNNVLGNDVLNPNVAGLRGSNEGKKSESTDKMEAADFKIVSEIGCQPHEIVNNPANEEIAGSLDVLVEKIVADAKSSVNLVDEVGPLENQLPAEAEFQKHEVAASKPVMKGRTRSANALATAMEMDGFLNDIDELMTEKELVELMTLNDNDMKSDPSKEDIDNKGETKTRESGNMENLASARNPGEVSAKSASDANACVREGLVAGISQSQSPVSGFVKPETLLRPKDKFHKRKVSAIRDFPLHCGYNVHLPVEENYRALTSGNDFSVRRPQPHMVVTSQELSDGSNQIRHDQESIAKLDEHLGCDGIKITQAVGDESGSGTMSKKVEGHSVDDDRETVERESVSQSLRRNDQERSKHISSSLGKELQREIVHGLRAARPHRKEKVSRNNLDDTTCVSEVRQKNLPHEKKSKSVETRTGVAADFSGGTSMEKTTFSDFHEVDVTPISSVFVDEEHKGMCNQGPLAITPLSVFQPVLDDCNDNYFEDPNGKAIIVAPPSKVRNHTSGANERKKKLSWKQKGKFVARKSKPGSVRESNKTSYDAGENPGPLMVLKNEGRTNDVAYAKTSSAKNSENVDVSLPPFGSTTSGHNDARHKVRETLRLFNAICRKLLQREESKSTGDKFDPSSKSKKNGPRRFDLMTAKIIKERKMEVNTERQILGEVPGVEVGDEFQYRVELALVGIHRLYQGGIDWMKYDGVPVATSIVASGAYEDDLEHAEELYYCGSGGNIVGKVKTPEDQKLERGNLALNNSIDKGTPVRVVRGWKETRSVDPQDTRPKIVTTYVYDGLYTVVDCLIKERDKRKIFMFKLVRNPGQPELAWKELKKTNRSKIRPGTCVQDISQGQEQLAISAVNTLDNEKLPPFRYVSKMMYPDWLRLNPPSGCSCLGRCSDSRKCRCAAKNGGEIPYNHNGAIVESKPIVYECGPHCKCPPSCYNRVSQRGIRLQLEIFKTELRGWGVRPLTSVPSGSFICEYSGELLQDKEAEERIGNDEYLFDIGHNYQEKTLNPEEQASLAEEGGYTIDAAQYGNVGRFINHSCSPNLYAQYVIYDHDDKKMPHVMLFAMENIPPLQELTYHYNYSIDQVRDADGNIKVKKCYCGSVECNGRLY